MASRLATALVGDIAGSRELASEDRARLQGRLDAVLKRLNHVAHGGLLSRFTLTLGDEFQALLCRPAILPEVLWRLRADLQDVEWWVGVGHGALDTELRPTAVGMDGPVFHRARGAVEEAKSSGRRGGVFLGFDGDEAVLDGLARAAEALRAELTASQIQAVELVRGGTRSQTEAARQLGVSRQAVSKRLKAARWDALQEVERALASLLSRYDTCAEWEDR